MASDAITSRGRAAGRRVVLAALTAAAVGLSGCDQLKAIGAMVGLGGDEPKATATPRAARKPPARPAAAGSPGGATAPAQQAAATASPVAPAADPAAQAPAAGPASSPAAAVAAATPASSPAAAGASPAGSPAPLAAAAQPVPSPAAAQPAPSPAAAQADVVPAGQAQAASAPVGETAAGSVAQANPSVVGGPVPETPLLPTGDEPYDPSGKRDPFRPYLTSAELAARRAKEQLSPLERLELSQLKLVAVIWGGRQNHAMVEDPAGVGYVLRVGTKIGPNGGRVARITPDAVYVEESFRDAAGSVLTNQYTLRLPAANPGGKGS